MALTKAMSSSHGQAMAICDKSHLIIEALNGEDRHSRMIVYKYWLKRALLLKHASSFKESYDTLLDLEARVKVHSESLEDDDEGSEGEKEEKALLSMQFKTARELARVCSLLSNWLDERRFERQAWDIFI